MSVLPYFAYGSNLCFARLRGRVPGVETIGVARLSGHELRWHKRSNTDGSGKCSVAPSDRRGAVVHGALFRVPSAEKHLLDRVEGVGNGYEERPVRVEVGAAVRDAWTYVAAASHIDDALRPFEWYRELVVEGARAHELPRAWVEALRRVPARPDPDPDRARRNLEALPCRGPFHEESP